MITKNKPKNYYYIDELSYRVFGNTQNTSINKIHYILEYLKILHNAVYYAIVEKYPTKYTKAFSPYVLKLIQQNKNYIKNKKEMK